MNLILAMQLAKTGVDYVQGQANKKNAKRVANAQKAMADKFYEYNTKQLEKAYDNAFSNYMTQYINERNQQTMEYTNAQTQLNMLASQSGVNLESSSFDQDAQNQLDMEFNTNLQNSLNNTINRMAELTVQKTTNEVRLGQQYLTQNYQIDNALYEVEKATSNKLMADLMDVGSTTYKDYRTYKSKNKDGGFTDYLSDDLLKWK